MRLAPAAEYRQTEGCAVRICSFYTPDDGYPQDAARLIASLDRLGIPAEVALIESAGSWKGNCMRRASWLLERLRGSDQAVLWIDADAVVRSDPRPYLETLTEFDVGFHFLRGKELLGGTMLFRATPLAVLLLERWVGQNIVYPQAFRSQTNLARAVESIQGLRVAHLPCEYTFIFDTMRTLHPDVAPVIEHFQASRRLRNAGRMML